MRYSPVVIAVIFLLIISSHGVRAGSTVKQDSGIQIIYDNHINQGTDLVIQMQINFNCSYADLVIQSNSTELETVWSKNSFSAVGEWIDIRITSQHIPDAGSYTGRISARRYGQSNFSIVQSMFFDFKVRQVLGVVGTAITTATIAGSYLVFFLLYKDKQRVQKQHWNKISLFEYIKHYKFLIFAVIIIPLIGFVVWRFVI